MMNLKKVFFSGLLISAFMTGSAMADCRSTAGNEAKPDLKGEAPAAQTTPAAVTAGSADEQAKKAPAKPAEE
ncbi:hypothetical protein WDW86_01755 [Bdellovibrionota bacterium FG-2]